MILRFIFQSAALTALHTGIAAGIAAAMDGENAIATGLTSFAVGIPSLVAGAYAGDRLARKRNHLVSREQAAKIGGWTGYAAGSMIGFVLKYS